MERIGNVRILFVAGFGPIVRDVTASRKLYSEILHGAVSRLPSRLPDLMFWVTLPFLGAEGAAAERERARLSMQRS